MTATSTAAHAQSYTKPRLNAGEVARFRDEGYLVAPGAVFGPAKFAGLVSYFEQMLAEWPADQRPESMDVPHFVHTRLFEWLLDDAVLDLVEPLLGPDIALFSSHFICKPGGDGRRVPWHEDSAYWGDMLTPMQVVTVWLAIDPSDTGNGCMRIIPRSHRTGRSGYSDYDPVTGEETVFGTEIRRGQLDPAQAVDLVLEPNHASLHDGKLMHGSTRNSSPRRRCGYTMRYTSTRSLLHPRCQQHHQLYLARGVDHAGNSYGDPTRPNHQIVEQRAKVYIKKGH
jgi:hypothetical protein